MYVCVCVCMHVCMYVHTYVYINIYIYIAEVSRKSTMANGVAEWKMTT